MKKSHQTSSYSVFLILILILSFYVTIFVSGTTISSSTLNKGQNVSFEASDDLKFGWFDFESIDFNNENAGVENLEPKEIRQDSEPLKFGYFNENEISSTTPVPSSPPPENRSIANQRYHTLIRQEFWVDFHLKRMKGFDGALGHRLDKYFPIKQMQEYCITTLYNCMYLHESFYRSDDNERTEDLNHFIASIFGGGGEEGHLSKKRNSLNHPICYDSFRVIGSLLLKSQISWLIENDAAYVIFDNAECLMSLSDYSFITEEIYDKQVQTHFASKHVDFLQISKFWETASIPVIMHVLVHEYDHLLHEANLIRYFDRISDSFPSSPTELFENPLLYPVLSQLIYQDFISLSNDYEVNSKFIIKYIRNHGVDGKITLSLLCYIFRTNQLISEFMTEIGKTWVVSHKNLKSELKEHGDSSMKSLFKARNEKFNEEIGEIHEKLLYIRDQRECLNDLLGELVPEEKTSESCLQSLKLIAQTPFEFLMRKSFENRKQFDNSFYIHPEDRGNLVPLPRLLLDDPSEQTIMMAANSPLIRSALWNNVFTKFRHSENMADDDKKETREKTLVRNDLFIYRESQYEAVPVHQLIENWKNLLSHVKLSSSFTCENIMYRFIECVSYFPPPSVPFIVDALRIERNLDISRVFEVLSSLSPLNLRHLHHDFCPLNFLWVDSPQILEFLRQQQEERYYVNYSTNNSSGYGFKCKFSVSKIEEYIVSATEEFKTIANNDLNSFYKVMRKLYTVVMMLGQDIGSEGGFDEMMIQNPDSVLLKFLNINGNGRLLSKGQIENLLKSQKGRIFLKNNSKMARTLMDYSAFSLADMVEFDISIDKIIYGTFTLNHSVKLMCLLKRGFSSFDYPVGLVYSLGMPFWFHERIHENIAVWELLNPFIIANDPELASIADFEMHLTEMGIKLGESFGKKEINYILKWLIAQDWYALIYYVTIGQHEISSECRQKLTRAYENHTRKEIRARTELNFYFAYSAASCTSSLKSSLSMLKKFSSQILTPFRKSTQITTLLSDDTNLKDDLLKMIEEYLPKNEKEIWKVKVEILHQFNSKKTTELISGPTTQVALTCLETLPHFDAVIYLKALKLTGWSIEQIYNDKLNLPLRFETIIEVESAGASNEIKTNKKKQKKSSSKSKIIIFQ